MISRIAASPSSRRSRGIPCVYSDPAPGRRAPL